MTHFHKYNVISPYSSLEHGTSATLRPGAVPSFSEYSQIDGHNKIMIDPISEHVPRHNSIEQFSNQNEKINHIEHHVASCENFIVQLTQIRADCEDCQPQSASPKKSSRFGKSSMKRNKRESSKNSSSSISSNVTDLSTSHVAGM